MYTDELLHRSLKRIALTNADLLVLFVAHYNPNTTRGYGKYYDTRTTTRVLNCQYAASVFRTQYGSERVLAIVVVGGLRSIHVVGAVGGRAAGPQSEGS